MHPSGKKKKERNQYGKCPKCGRRVRINFDGTVRDHYYFQSTLYSPKYRIDCDGKEEPPTDEFRGPRITLR